jgi:hypothetical protein
MKFTWIIDIVVKNKKFQLAVDSIRFPNLGMTSTVESSLFVYSQRWIESSRQLRPRSSRTDSTEPASPIRICAIPFTSHWSNLIWAVQEKSHWKSVRRSSLRREQNKWRLTCQVETCTVQLPSDDDKLTSLSVGRSFASFLLLFNTRYFYLKSVCWGHIK